MTLQDILLLVKKENEYFEYLAWQAEQEKLYYYYAGDKHKVTEYLKIALKRTYKDDDVNEMQLNYINITKKIVNQQAVVYKNPASRYIIDKDEKENTNITEYYSNILPNKINSIDKKASRLAKLANTSITEIYFENGKISYRIDPNFLYRVVCEDEDPKKVKLLMYDKEINDKIYIYVWTKDYHFRINPEGNEEPIPGRESEDFKNYYGVIPFVFLTYEDGLDIWGDGQNDLINVNEQINFLLTNLINDQIIIGAGGIPYFINFGLDKKGTMVSREIDGEVKSIREIRLSRKHPLYNEDVRQDLTKPEAGFLSFDPYISDIRDTVDWNIKMIARTKGLNPNSFLEEAQATSGYSKMVDSLEQLEMRIDDIEPCREYEKERFNITRIVNNYYASTVDGKKYGLQQIPEDLELKIDFAEVEIHQTQDEIWKDREQKEKRNMGTAIDWLIEDNPDLSIDEARKIIEDNKKINSENQTKPASTLGNLFTRADAQKQNSEE